MERGLYSAASGMLAQQALQEVLAQNLANANTVGYKQDNQTFKALHALKLERLPQTATRGVDIGELGLGVAPDQVYTDFQAGPISQTGAPLDASLAPGQFFAVQTPAGERYTRAGSFQLDGTGNLMTTAGNPVLDQSGVPIVVRAAPPYALEPNGTLTAGGKPAARLKVVEGGPGSLKKAGETLFATVGPQRAPLARAAMLRPQTLEQSNVNVVRGMVQMISVSRSFEMAQRAIITQDELLKHAANEVGKL